MRSTFLCILILAVFSVATAQTGTFADFPADCHAGFAANPDLVNPMVFHFQDQSTGQINHWQWSFGDGGTSSVQNPQHTYSAGGTYFVCLTVSDSDSGNICHDMICIPVTVHEPGTCVADYIYARDSLNLLDVKFTDKSTGNINSWHWNFGDGTVSADRNPHHTFPGYAKYNVCLMAYNSDSISVCNDVKCDSLNVAGAEHCQASFVYVLDSLNHEPNTFKFRDTSTGNPNHYHWFFDDGASSSARNVSHQFHVDGYHKVCLQITKEVQGVSTCTDSTCVFVKTAKYFNLGGHLFAGAFPINNPVSTGDTGQACLYMKFGERLLPYDTVTFTNLGYYAFPRVLNGTYLLQASLTRGSAHYADYFPAYFPQVMKWKDATMVNLADTSTYDSHIHMLPVTEVISGPGSIKGKVINSASPHNAPGIPFAEIILYNTQLTPLLFAQSEKSGLFELDNLPFGSYFLYVEAAGRFSRLTPIWIDASAPVADSVLLEVFDFDVTGIADRTSPPVTAGDLFPNPANNEVSLIVQVQYAGKLNYEIRSMTGQTVLNGKASCHAGANLVTIPAGEIPRGIYVFSLYRADGSRILNKKLMKY
ncbi:MAG: PKD domain-containing protein [Bacteroidota bacterium]